MMRRGLIVAVSASLPGCSGTQSPLNPAGPQAEAIASVTWLFFSVSAVVYVLTMADMAGIVERLSGPAGANLERPIVDRTGLEGRFDFEVRFSGIVGRVSVPQASEPSGPDFFTAVREQLGLKLEPVTAPVDVLVIQSVQPPTEN